ncbi:C2 domain-containing family protein, partial [Trifolium medium]|nr:C2 domain-containing family protein [Trifolium medium]
MSQNLPPFQLLELNVISAQDLASLGRNMRTYAVAWVHPDRKLSTRVDTQGHTNPTWNDKFVFRVDEDFLYNDTSAIMIEIYALHWFKDIHVGTVRVLVGNLIPAPARPFHNDRAPLGMRFVALQVRRPSGRPQGILNIGFTVLDSSMRSMPIYTHDASAVGYQHLMGEKDTYDSHNHLSPRVVAAGGGGGAGGGKPELRRTKSDTSSILVASEAIMRQQRNSINKERANSAISGSEVSEYKVKKSNKKKKKSKKSSSKASSIISSVSGKFT